MTSLLMIEITSRTVSVYLVSSFIDRIEMSMSPSMDHRFKRALPFWLVTSSLVLSLSVIAVLICELIIRRIKSEGVLDQNAGFLNTSTLRPVFVLNDGRLTYANKYVNSSNNNNSQTISNYYNLSGATDSTTVITNTPETSDHKLMGWNRRKTTKKTINQPSSTRFKTRRMSSLRFPMVVFRRKTIREKISKERQKISNSFVQLDFNEQQKTQTKCCAGSWTSANTANALATAAVAALTSVKNSPPVAEKENLSNQEILDFSLSTASSSSSSASTSSTLSTNNFQRVIIREKIIKSSNA